MFNKFKYEILKKPLELAKTHDYSATKNPKLTIIFLHGITASSTTYHQTLKYLEGTHSLKNARFLAYDWLGHGKSYTSDKLEYTYDEQINALEKSIEKAKIKTPIILVAHSMGTLIATHYAVSHKKTIAKLILVSPAVFTKEDIKLNQKTRQSDVFTTKIDPKIRHQKVFVSSMQNIVMNSTNYTTFEKLTTPTTMIYGAIDQFISIPNLEKLQKQNPKYLSSIETPGKHSVTRDKYVKILETLEKYIYETF